MVLFGCGIILTAAHSVHCSGVVHAQSGVVEQIPIQITYVGRIWYNQSVYCVTNTSGHRLTNFVVYDKRYSVLPILYIGTKMPPGISEAPPLSENAHDAPPHSSVWVVGSTPPPFVAYFSWRDSNNNKEHSVTLTSNPHA
jgi:hypothetical protein